MLYGMTEFKKRFFEKSTQLSNCSIAHAGTVFYTQDTNDR